MVGGIFCDLEKACDSVNYDILLSKPECYGIKDIYKALYESYLHNKYQRVSIYDTKKKFPYAAWQRSNVAFHRALPTDPCFFS
jgi:hypothetical protein